MELSDCKPGVQIAYFPTHANGNWYHPDLEEGFVECVNKDERTATCRFWNKRGMRTLRTLANGEKCSVDDLMSFVSVQQSVVEKLLKLIHDGDLSEVSVHLALSYNSN